MKSWALYERRCRGPRQTFRDWQIQGLEEKDMRQVFWPVVVLMTVALATAQDDPFRSAPPEEVEALKARVDNFYTLFQQGQFREAETFVAEEARDVYYNAPKARIFGYKIRSAEFNPDLNEATVLMTVETLTALSSSPLQQPLQSTWKRVDGEWYLWLEAVEAGETYQTPAGPMRFNTESGAGGSRPKNFSPPNLASMQTMYEVSSRNLQFPTESDKPVTQTVTVKNKFQDQLMIERLTREIPGMEIEIESEAIPKDGETKISFTYDPALARLMGNKHFDFDLMPITQRVRIVMSFR